MRARIIGAAIVAVLVLAAGAPTADAQPSPVPQPKGVTESNLMTSLGGFRGTANVPIVMTGQTVTIEPGGQTGRQRHVVPSYIYVLEGTLITNSDGGPVGTAGVQYHAAGQSYMDPVGVWHNHSNPGQTPVKYLLLLISSPGQSGLTQKAKPDDD